MGCCVLYTAEIIPNEPDADNAAVGRIYTRFAVWFFCCAFNFGARAFYVGFGKDFDFMKKTNTAKTIHSLCEAAVFVAFAAVLALLKFPPFRIDLWIFGGSIDFVMLPLFIMCWRLDMKWSFPACFIFGVVKFLITGDSISAYGGIIAVLLDYILAYGVVGFASFFRKMKGGLLWGVLAGSAARFLVHFISGVTIYCLAIGDSVELFGMTFDHSTAWLYSLVYNGSYMLGETIYCFALALLLQRPLKKLQKD